jgi:hypothetical protein
LRAWKIAATAGRLSMFVQGGLVITQSTRLRRRALLAVLFGTHVPFDDAQLDALYRNHGRYVSAVGHVDQANVGAGFLLAADAQENQREAAHSSVGKK